MDEVFEIDAVLLEDGLIEVVLAVEVGLHRGREGAIRIPRAAGDVVHEQEGDRRDERRAPAQATAAGAGGTRSWLASGVEQYPLYTKGSDGDRFRGGGVQRARSLTRKGGVVRGAARGTQPALQSERVSRSQAAGMLRLRAVGRKPCARRSTGIQICCLTVERRLGPLSRCACGSASLSPNPGGENLRPAGLRTRCDRGVYRSVGLGRRTRRTPSRPVARPRRGARLSSPSPRRGRSPVGHRFSPPGLGERDAEPQAQRERGPRRRSTRQTTADPILLRAHCLRLW